MEEKEIEELDMNKKPKNEVAVFGLGVLFKKLDKLLEKLDKMSKTIYFMEKRQQEWYEKEHPEAKKEY